MQQTDLSSPLAVDPIPQWETPELVVADVTTTTLSGGANNLDAGSFSS